MGHGNHRALILLQVLLEPVNALGIEVVGRLVEQEHVGLLEQQSAQRHATAFATREVGHSPVARWTVEGIHGTLQFGVDVPGVGSVDDVLHLSLPLHQLVHLVGVAIVLLQSELVVDVLIFGKCVIHLLHALHHVFLHGLALVERWILRQVAHGVAGTPHHLALCGLFQSGDDFHQG